MLDLNFGVTVAHSDSMEIEDFPANSVTQMEDSGTSNSSIVNAEEALAPSHSGKDEDSSNNSSGFIFGIMRKQIESDGANWVEDENPPPELLTQPLFPVVANGRDWDLELRLGLAASATPQWLNLSFPDSGGGGQAELKNLQQKQQLVRKSRRGPRSRSSQYRGVTFYRRTGRWESHIWDCGKQVYLGGFDTAHAAARAYDRAAIKFRGIDADINFNTSDYEEDIKQTKNLTKEEFVYILRRHSSGFSRGSSKFHGAMFRKCGQWEAKVEPKLGKKVYDQPCAKYPGSDIVSELGSTASNMEINLDAIRGNGENLDLSLGISQNADVFIGNEKMGVISYHFDGGEKLNAERTKMDGCDASRMEGRQPQTTAMASHHPSNFGSYPGFQPNHLGRIAEKRNDGAVVSSSSPSAPQRVANWARQMSGSGKVSHVPVFSIEAASSGFSSFASVAPPPAVPFNHNIQPPALSSPGFVVLI